MECTRCLRLCFLIITTVSCSYGWQPFEKELSSIRQCDDILKHIHKRHTYSPIPPHIAGEWASMRCEVRSGPEYILRKYQFHNNTMFEARQYYYSDPDCQKPYYVIIARGSVIPLQELWSIPGGTEMEYQLSHVSVMPLTYHAAKHIGSAVNQTCPGSVKKAWKALNHYEIFKFLEFEDRNEGQMFMDSDCTAALNFSLHELQLVRLEVTKHHGKEFRELHLGNIHTTPKNRQSHRPTSFQAPLIEMTDYGCGSTCRALRKTSDSFHPPKLHHSHAISGRLLQGEWVSMRCESRPHGLYLTRKVKFEPRNNTWYAEYYFTDDAECKQPSFKLKAKGSYHYEGNSKKVIDAENYKFNVENIIVKPQDQFITNTLNENHRECGLQLWKTDMEQDVTKTKGCGALGIKVPHFEYELVRLEKHTHGYLLFLGERPSDGSSPTFPDQRATSFQAPLIRCNYDDTQDPSMDNESYYWSHFTGGSTGVKASPLIILLTWLLLTQY